MLWRSRSDGSERIQLAFLPAVVAEPFISPDGTRVVFDNFADLSIGVVDMRGGPSRIAVNVVGPDRHAENTLATLRVRRGESLATLLGWAGLARLWDTTESLVVFEEKLAGVQGFRLEGRAVSRDEPPVCNLAAQQIDET